MLVSSTDMELVFQVFELNLGSLLDKLRMPLPSSALMEAKVLAAEEKIKELTEIVTRPSKARAAAAPQPKVWKVSLGAPPSPSSPNPSALFNEPLHAVNCTAEVTVLLPAVWCRRVRVSLARPRRATVAAAKAQGCPRYVMSVNILQLRGVVCYSGMPTGTWQ